ncbi:sodium/hydrogen exchanger 9-like [Actinia tenebrosa]|uniref:Sodium/hydrogen exchanger n=1 Tax=Actinia tenebrosa TaxID=6105 RepID=A0A6P8J6D4_ACTTE|nr:sodium/hydrogen exchanger 9-like [Actinia tenebrosa]
MAVGLKTLARLSHHTRHFHLWLFIAIASQIMWTVHGIETPTTLEGRKEDEMEHSHNTDSLSMMILITLLIVDVLIIWLFKIRRLQFIHETGVAMIIGVVVGFLIKYADNQNQRKPLAVKIKNCGNLTNAPRSVFVNINGTEYSYNLIGIRFPSQTSPPEESNEIESRATFNPEIFFYVLLPPIIFYAGYSMQKRYFFRNLGAILTYAFIGTTISCVSTGSLIYGFNKWTGVTSDFDYPECLLFGALISATDPVTVLAIFHDIHVDVDLYALVFGESVLNDAVALVLYRAIESYLAYNPREMRQFDVLSVLQAVGDFVAIFAGSFVIGCGMSCINALVTKLTKLGSFPVLETALLFLMSYCTFLAAEVANWSGIVAVLFCGITQQHYTYKNLTEESRVRTIQTFELMNFLAENFIFTYIGLSVFAFASHQWNLGFIGWTFLAIIVGRFLNIYPLSFLLNLGRTRTIPFNFQHMMFFSGLRGAIAFALAVRNSVSIPRQMMLTATLVIVIVSVIVLGGLTVPVLSGLGIRSGVDEHEEEKKARRLSLLDINDPSSSTPVDRIEKKIYEKAWLVRAWSKVDNKYLKPLFVEESALTH